MMTKANTASMLAAALLATALPSGLGAAAAPSPAQQTAPSSDWCDDGSDYGDDRERHCEVREFSVPAIGVPLHVNAAPNGGISIEGASRADILVRARVHATARTKDEARAIAARVEVVATGERVQASGPDNLDRRQSWSVSYRIEAPRQTALDLHSTNGGISIKDISSRIQFRTVNGGVTLARVGGSVEGRTSNGGVTIDLDGSTWDGQGLNVETTNGGVKLSIPEGYAAHIEASTNNGGLNIDFPVTLQGRIGRSLSTDIGGGGPTLRVRTSNGGVKIGRK